MQSFLFMKGKERLIGLPKLGRLGTYFLGKLNALS